MPYPPVNLSDEEIQRRAAENLRYQQRYAGEVRGYLYALGVEITPDQRHPQPDPPPEDG